MGKVAFEALEGPPRLHVADTVGNEQYTLHLDEPVSPEPVSTDGFEYPVSDAVRVETSGFDLGTIVRMHLWDEKGELLHTSDRDTEISVSAGDYYLEICHPVKTYIRFSGSVDVTPVDGRMRVRFDRPTSVSVGARSPRKQPAGTIITTSNPADVMTAFSYLGEGLLTTKPLRSYPNLRGYPPEVRVGNELDVSGDLRTGDQPVTMALPEELSFLYEAAPLVYYLNTDVQPSSKPELRVDGDSVYQFDSGSFGSEVAELLQHIFGLDCVVRTAGSYPIETVETNRLSGVIPFDLPELYEADQETRLRRYLDVPFQPVSAQVPNWPATGYVEPFAANIEAIPHLVAQLIPVRAVSPDRISGTEARRSALRAFTNGGSSTRAASEVFNGEASFVEIESSDNTNDIWVGNDIPILTNKLIVEGFRNRFERDSSDRNSIDVTIVCNESWMNAEATTVRDYYADAEDLPFNVTIYENLDRTSLESLLEAKTDFLHYIGHATADGLRCNDGYLDIASVESIGVEAFFLNACQSYRQAIKLVEGGAIGGIATLSDVTDDQANIVGRTAIRLLNIGYPLRMALEIARSRSIIGGQYLAVGDDSATLVSTKGLPNKCTVESTNDGYELTVSTYQTFRLGAGGIYHPWMSSEDGTYLTGKSIGPFELPAAELSEFLEFTNVPVEFDGEFRWAFDLAEELD